MTRNHVDLALGVEVGPLSANFVTNFHILSMFCGDACWRSSSVGWSSVIAAPLLLGGAGRRFVLEGRTSSIAGQHGVDVLDVHVGWHVRGDRRVVESLSHAALDQRIDHLLRRRGERGDDANVGRAADQRAADRRRKRSSGGRCARRRLRNKLSNASMIWKPCGAKPP